MGVNIPLRDFRPESQTFHSHETYDFEEQKLDLDYDSFWETIEQARTKGHGDLIKLLKTGTIRIGDAIPNKKFWEQIKKHKIEVQPNREALTNESSSNICSTGLDLDSSGISTSINEEESCDTVDAKKSGKYRRLVKHKAHLLIEEGIYETVFRIILDNVFNGHEVIISILDTLIDTSSEIDCLRCFDNTDKAKISIKMNEMFSSCEKETELSKKTVRLVMDLKEIQSERVDDKNIKKIFKHPVFEILILNKWEDYKMTYIVHGRLFTLFVFLFTYFVKLLLLEASKSRCNPKTNITSISESDALKNCSDWLFENGPWLFKDGSWRVNDHHWASGLVDISGKYDWLLIFKYNKETFIMYFTVMGGLFIREFFELSWTWFLWSKKEDSENISRNKHQNKRREHIMIDCIVNLFLFLFFHLVCHILLDPELYVLLTTLSIFWIYLVITEIAQFYILVIKPAITGKTNIPNIIKKIVRNRYFMDPENYLEIMLFISFPVAFCTRFEIFSETREPTKDASFRGIVAIGVFSAWTTLVIKLGNVSHSTVGEFVKIFYTIIMTKLWSYMKVCFLLMVAFSLAFWIILEDYIKPTDNVTFEYGFWVNLAMTITMSTGEFNTGEFYRDIEDNKAIKAFAMIFLIGLVILSTITLVNLLVAAVISDYETMKDNVDIENLYFIAEYIVEEEMYKGNFSHNCSLHCLKTTLKTTLDYIKNIKNKNVTNKNGLSEVKSEFKGTLEYCPHLICNNDVCQLAPLPIPRPGVARYNPEREANEMEPLYLRLFEIRGRDRSRCKNHGGNRIAFEDILKIWG